MQKKLINLIQDLLIKKNKTISIAESCTGGLLSNTLTNVPGSTKYFKLGIIAYSNESKIKLLNIPKKLLILHGAVSSQVCILMAKNIKKISGTDISIATTGIAGPGGGTKLKPVGLVYIGIINDKKKECKKINFKGTRKQNKEDAVQQALFLLRNSLSITDNIKIDTRYRKQ